MKSIIVKCTLAALLWLGVSFAGHAQQILSERVLAWPNTQNGFVATDLLQLQPDSLRLLGDFQSGTNTGGLLPTKISLRRVLPATCDTLPVRGASFMTPVPSLYTSAGLVTRRGRVFVSSSYLNAINLPISLRLFGRDGTTRWQQAFSLSSNVQEASGLLEAPDRGFFVAVRTSAATSGVTYLVRLDSLGNTLWQRAVFRAVSPVSPFAPVYTQVGTILYHSIYLRNNTYFDGITEVSQNGDSLTTRPTSPDPTQGSRFNNNYKGSLLPLQDGGFLVAAEVDSARKGFYRPYLTRFDRNLNVVWSTVYRQQGSNQYRFTHPYELADGSFVTLCNSENGIQQTYYLFRFSASGILLQRYAFTSPLITSLLQTGTGNSGPGFNTPPGLQPLSDSTFMLVSNLRTTVANKQVQRTYLAHLKVAGLRRVVNSTYIPAANSPLATLAPASAWPAPAYPNPASTSVTVPLPALPAEARLTLRDLLGRQVRTQAVAPGTSAATVAVGGLAPGVYLLSLERAGQAPVGQRLTITGP